MMVLPPRAQATPSIIPRPLSPWILRPPLAYAMTHVYAVGANEAGQTITKPNMSLVPIMGSDLNLAGGKAYHMDCELYEQPNIQLGYYVSPSADL